MKNLNISIQVQQELYLKNPDSTDLGRSIVSSSIKLINSLGFETFTFKKLGEIIKSPESSIYRYFESKHTLLVYLTSWYWSWIEYLLVFTTVNVESPIQRLKEAVKILTQQMTEDSSFPDIDVRILENVIITESAKTYLTKHVDQENAKGYFRSYKQIVKRVSDIILEINPKYEYPHMLITTMIEGAHHQRYFAEHLPSLTNTYKNKENNISDFYTHLVFKAIEE
jgi:hypothetical protein